MRSTGAADGQTTKGYGKEQRREKKPYASPRLVRYGDVRDVTLGPSPGSGESGNPITFRAP